MRDQIQARRDELASHIAAATAQYEQLEQSLRLLDRQLCVMQGGLVELDALLSGAPHDETIRDDRDMLMSRLGEAHQTIDVMEEEGTTA